MIKIMPPSKIQWIYMWMKVNFARLEYNPSGNCKISSNRKNGQLRNISEFKK